jgi:hypothetical protein
LRGGKKQKTDKEENRVDREVAERNEAMAHLCALPRFTPKTYMSIVFGQ